MRQVNFLLVEDNEGDIFLITEALKEGGLAANIDVAKDGEEAIDFLKNGKNPMPGIILLDINLPKISGHEVLEYIKSSEELQHLPVIMLTTSSASSDVTKSYRNFANCHITKPVDVNKFLEVVSEIEEFWTSIAQLPGNTSKNH